MTQDQFKCYASQVTAATTWVLHNITTYQSQRMVLEMLLHFLCGDGDGDGGDGAKVNRAKIALRVCFDNLYMTPLKCCWVCTTYLESSIAWPIWMKNDEERIIYILLDFSDMFTLLLVA